MFTTDFETEIASLDAKIAQAKTYLKKDSPIQTAFIQN